MQLNATTDYAIRIVTYLAQQQRIVPSSELSEKLGITKTYVLKLMHNLLEAGICTQYRGVNGGYAIARKPEDITLLDVLTTMENTVKINRCLEADHYCNRKFVPHCMVHHYYADFQKIFEDYFSSITIADLVRDQEAVFASLRDSHSDDINLAIAQEIQDDMNIGGSLAHPAKQK